MNLRRKVSALDMYLGFISMYEDMGVDSILWAECSQAFSSQNKGELRIFKGGGGAIGRPWGNPKTKGGQKVIKIEFLER